MVDSNGLLNSLNADCKADFSFSDSCTENSNISSSISPSEEELLVRRSLIRADLSSSPRLSSYRLNAGANVPTASFSLIAASISICSLVFPLSQVGYHFLGLASL